MVLPSERVPVRDSFRQAAVWAFVCPIFQKPSFRPDPSPAQVAIRLGLSHPPATQGPNRAHANRNGLAIARSGPGVPTPTSGEARPDDHPKGVNSSAQFDRRGGHR